MQKYVQQQLHLHIQQRNINIHLLYMVVFTLLPAVFWAPPAPERNIQVFSC